MTRTALCFPFGSFITGDWAHPLRPWRGVLFVGFIPLADDWCPLGHMSWSQPMKPETKLRVDVQGVWKTMFLLIRKIPG